MAEENQTRRQYRDSKYGEGYDAFRIGLTFRQARRMMFVHTDESTEWRYKRRGSVLGFMFQLKQQMWHYKLDAEYHQERARGGAE